MKNMNSLFNLIFNTISNNKYIEIDKNNSL